MARVGSPGTRTGAWSAASAEFLVVSGAPSNDVLPPEAMEYFKRLLPASELTSDLGIEIDRDHVLYRFHRGDALAVVDVNQAWKCAKPAGALCIEVVDRSGAGADALATEARATLIQAARGATGASPWRPAEESPSFARRPDALAPGTLARGELLLVLVAGGVLISALRFRRTLASRAAAVPAALFLLGWAVRLVARAGPGDIHDVMGLNSQGRAGWAVYVHVLRLLRAHTLEDVWSIHRFLGALSVPLLYLVMRQRFSALAATAGAAVLATLPLAARFSASDTQYVPLCAAFLGSVVAFGIFGRTGSLGAWAMGLGLLTCAMQLRPEGTWLVVPAVLLSASHSFPARKLTRPSVLALCAAFLALNGLLLRWALEGARQDGGQPSPFLSYFVGVGAVQGSPWRDFAMSPWPVSLLVAGGAVAAMRAGRVGVTWLAATLVAMPFALPAIGNWARIRYHLPSMHLACGLAGLGIAAVVEASLARLRRPMDGTLAAAVAALLAVLASLPRTDVLRRMYTFQLELDAFRAAVRERAGDCRVVALLYGQDAGLVPFDDPTRERVLDLDEFLGQGSAGRCFVYYREASCFSPDIVGGGRSDFHEAPACRDFEARVPMTPLAEWSLPASPCCAERYVRDPLPVGLYRIEPR